MKLLPGKHTIRFAPEIRDLTLKPKPQNNYVPSNPVEIEITDKSEEQSRFVAAAKQAFEKQDADALMALVCWDRVPDKFKERRRKQYARDVAESTTDIALTDPDPNYPDHEWKDTDGVSYRANLPVVKRNCSGRLTV